MVEIIPNIQHKIHTIRGKQVMLDRNLAELYEVETKALNQTVKRNKERFPSEFMFQLSKKEFEFILRSQFVTSNNQKGGRRYFPYAFTEHGVTALAGVIKSKKAVQMNIQIIKAFVAMRHFLLENKGIFQKFQQIDQKLVEHDDNFNKIFTAMEAKQLTPTQGIFYDGQIFDAYTFVVDLVKQARKEIVLIDNYIDESVLTLLSNKKKGVIVTIYTKEAPERLRLAQEKFIAQYGNLEIKEFSKSHDRFIVIDSVVYHVGASLKDVGKKWFAFSKINVPVLDTLHISRNYSGFPS